jgi:HK97 gp10 family phage protein
MKNVTIEEFANELSQKQKRLETEIGKALAKSCALIQTTAITSMRDTVIDTDKSYYTHNKKIPHHPSIAGNPPAVDTGTLRRSVTYQVDENELVGYVGSNLKDPPYGAYLEFGTSRMKPRPWLKPATEKSMEKIKEIMAGAVKVGIYD